MTKKKETESPELKTIFVNVEVELSDQEKIDKGLELVDKLIEIHEVEVEAKETAKDYKNRIGGLLEDKEKIARVIHEGKENRFLESVKERDDDLKQFLFLEVVEGKKTSNVLKSDPYGAGDYQLPIPEQGGDPE